MKIAIITSSDRGTAAHHLPVLIQNSQCKISMVIVSDAEILDKKKYYKRKLIKLKKIGILGTLNGIRMRKWFDEDIKKLLAINSLKEICQQNNIPYHQVPSVNSPLTFNLINNANIDLGVSLGNGYISKKIFTAFTKGMINIHHEELPNYQNASSVIWQLYNGSRFTGFSVHKIDTKIDTGDILYQERVPIIFKNTLAETVSVTFISILEHSARGLVKVINNFDFLFSNAVPQGKGSSYTTPTIWEFFKIKKQYKKLKKQLH